MKAVVKQTGGEIMARAYFTTFENTVLIQYGKMTAVTEFFNWKKQRMENEISHLSGARDTGSTGQLNCT